MRDTTRLFEKCEAMGITLNSEKAEKLVLFYEMLVEKNRVMNLTAITDWDEVVDKHFVDSLSLVKCLDIEKVETIVDLGTGAGFPGIPLKIVFPHLQMTLMDSLGKRVHFLESVIEACKLTDIEAVHGRAEDLARKKGYREHFDLCVSRAVANLSTLSEYCLPFIHVGGTFVAYKSDSIEDELVQASRALFLLGGDPKISPVSFTLPGTDIARTLVFIKKDRPTPRVYPRRPGTPAKEPIRYSKRQN